MTHPRWYSIHDLARATGLSARYIRQLLDDDLIRYLQPGGPNTKRLLNQRTVQDLERIGILVSHDLLTGNAGKTGKAGEIRAQHDTNGE